MLLAGVLCDRSLVSFGYLGEVEQGQRSSLVPDDVRNVIYRQAQSELSCGGRSWPDFPTMYPSWELASFYYAPLDARTCGSDTVFNTSLISSSLSP